MNISTNFERKNYKEDSLYKEWCDAMNSKLEAMKVDNTWTIIPLPPK